MGPRRPPLIILCLGGIKRKNVTKLRRDYQNLIRLLRENTEKFILRTEKNIPKAY